jgi:hypothetical protein
VLQPTPLVPNDDPNVPAGSVWNITHIIRGVPNKGPYPIQILTSDGPSVDLSKKTPVSPPTPIVGEITITNLGSTGQVLTFTNNAQASWQNPPQTIPLPLAVASGGTGATTAAGARTALGLGGASTLNVGTTANTVAAGNDGRIVLALQGPNNLSDVASPALSRGNLGLGGASTLNVGTAPGTVAAGDDSRIVGAAQKSANLSDLANAATARTSLGLGNSATRNVGTANGTVAAGDDGRIVLALQGPNNLSDVSSPALSRGNLGLGGAAVLNVGTTTSTVAAGDDSRITGAVQTAGHGLTKTGTQIALNTPILSADLPAALTTAQGAVMVESSATVLNPVGDIAGIGLSNRVVYSDHTHPLQPWQFSVIKYGATGNLNCVVDAVTNGTAVVTSASGKFTPSMVGMSVAGKGFLTSGQTTLRAKVLSYQSPTQVTLDTAATSTATGLQMVWGTDDTAAFQAAQNAAVAYGNGSPFSKIVQVVIPMAPGGFGYMIDGNLTFTDGTNAVYNGQIVTGLRSDRLPGLTVEWWSPVYAGATRHWNSDYPHFTGCSLFSTLTFSSQTAQATSDTHSIANGGNPAVISGPTGKFGYGVTGTNPQFNNITMVMRNISIINAHSASGWTISPFNFYGMARAHLHGCGFGTSGVVQYYLGSGGSGGNTDFNTLSSFSSGASLGGLMPAAGNNADNVVEDCCWNGGFTYGPLLTEHTVCKGINRSLYSWIGVGVAGNYGDGGSGAGSLHAIELGQFCIEACTYHLGVWGAGAAGIGPYIRGTIDTEGTVQVRGVTNIAANLAALTGEIHLTGAPSTPTFTFGTNLRMIKETQVRGAVAAPSFTLGTAQINTFYRDMELEVTGGTVTAIKVSTLAGGATAPTMTTKQGTSGVYIVPAGCWWEIDGSVAPTISCTLL